MKQSGRRIDAKGDAIVEVAVGLLELQSSTAVKKLRAVSIVGARELLSWKEVLAKQ